MLHRTRRTIGIKYFQAIALRIQFIAYRKKRAGSLDGGNSTRLLVTVNPIAHKIIGRIVANLLQNPWNKVG